MSRNSSVEGENTNRTRPISSRLKRFLSRESNVSDSVSVDKVPHLIVSASLAPDILPSKGNKITDEVIEELDEQLTVSQITQLQQGDRTNRPRVKVNRAEEVFIDVKDSGSPTNFNSLKIPIYSRSQSSSPGMPSLFEKSCDDTLSCSPAAAERDNYSRLTSEYIQS